MEAITTEGISWLLSVGTGGGFVALVWITVKFFGASQTEAVGAYSDLYKLVKAERDEFAREIAELREEMKMLRVELEAERKARMGLERELAQVGTSAAYLIGRDDK